MSPYYAEYIKDVKNGTTEWQRKREQLRRFILAGAGAGLQGFGGLIQNRVSAEQSEADAARHAKEYAESPHQDYMGTSAPDRTQAPAWLGNGGEGNRSARDLGISPDSPINEDPYSHLRTDGQSVEDLAKTTDANHALNDSASSVPIATWYTTPGLEEHAADADALTHDTQTAQSGMKQGGMLNSLPRVQR